MVVVMTVDKQLVETTELADICIVDNDDDKDE